MFTQLDKALIALAMAIIYILRDLFGVQIGPLTEENIERLIMFITPVLVYFIPNKR